MDIIFCLITAVSQFIFVMQVKEFFGVCKKGYAPYNPRKQNQDSIIMEEDPKTKCLLFAALDGHGELGDHVSQYFRYWECSTLLFSHFVTFQNYVLALIPAKQNIIIHTPIAGIDCRRCSFLIRSSQRIVQPRLQTALLSSTKKLTKARESP